MTHAPIRIGVLGTHSTGKTLLLKRIESSSNASKPVCATTACSWPAPASSPNGPPDSACPRCSTTVTSTEWIITQGIADELAAIGQGADVVLAGRAPLDALAYLRAAAEYRGEILHRRELERLRQLTTTQIPQYRLLLATVLDPALPVDTRHTYDPRYRALVNSHVHQLLDEEDIDHQRVTSDPDSHARAVEWALQLCVKERAA
ncbi:hypothetical protein [Streptomyces sp. CC224B]|uniref:hypothetical protein n=1 Tax=Streptomyces sp. CC224B TaxID=3044571 RepID=UPI0024A9C244|nr:hypothetical protein [Streptomyces sp. CC224B]